MDNGQISRRTYRYGKTLGKYRAHQNVGQCGQEPAPKAHSEGSYSQGYSELLIWNTRAAFERLIAEDRLPVPRDDELGTLNNSAPVKGKMRHPRCYADAYGFTEGFDTPDLKVARALLDELVR